jgi:hypothetical protein
MTRESKAQIGGLILIAIVTTSAVATTEFYSDGSIGEGEVHSNVTVHGTATLEMTGGYAFDLATHDSSTLNLTGGEIDFQGLTALGSSTVNMSGAAVFGNVVAMYSSHVNISGGAVTGRVLARDSSVANITGGYVNNVWASHSAIVNISGGKINGYLRACTDSQVNIYGFDLFAKDSGGEWGSGLVLGTWEDGTEFTIPLVGDAYSHIQLIPEPCTVSLLTLGVLPLLRKRRK